MSQQFRGVRLVGAGTSDFLPSRIDDVGITINLLAGQTADALDVVNSSGTVLAKIDKLGNITGVTQTSSGLLTATAGANITGTLAVTGAETISTTLGVTGVTTPTGGIASPTATIIQHYWGQSGDPTGSTTSGTDTVGIANKLWTTQIFIPMNMSVTGMGFLVGSVGGTDKVVMSMYTAAGVLVANTTVAGGGTTVGTAAQFQAIDFAVAYGAIGPGNYILGVNTSGTTGRIRTNPQTGAKSVGVQYSQTTATPAAITPTTGYTVSTAPFVFVYGT